MVDVITAACGGFLAGWICRAQLIPMGPPRGTRDDWRRRFNHENRPPAGPPPLRLDPGRTIRGNQRNGGPTTPKPETPPSGTIRKPQFPHGLVIDAHGHVVGYIPLPDPQGGTPNPPPSDP
jgi:hypothetical protein